MVWYGMVWYGPKPDCKRKHLAMGATDDSKCSTVSSVAMFALEIVGSFSTVDTAQRHGSPHRLLVI